MAACSLAKGSRRQYQGHFNILVQAAEAGGFDPLAMSTDDVHFSCLFFVLSRSVYSLDSFLSGVEHHLTEHLEAKMDPVHLRHLMRHASFNTTAEYIDSVSTRNSRMEFTKSLLLP